MALDRPFSSECHDCAFLFYRYSLSRIIDKFLDMGMLSDWCH